LAQNTIQNSSYLFPEDCTVYVAAWSSALTTLQELSSATWINAGALAEFSIESANASVQPAALNVEHAQIVTKEAETINITLQEFNSSVVSILRGGVAQTVSTTVTIVGSTSTSAATADVMYSGGAGSLTPLMVKIHTKLSDGRNRWTFYPYVHYMSGGAAPNPKAQATGEYQTQAFTLEARKSTAVSYNSRKQFRIEVFSTAST
jgi:hypothetical protein